MNLSRPICAVLGLALGLALIAASPSRAADQAAVARLQAGERDCAGCDLFQAELGYTRLAGVRLTGARLRQASLTVAVMSGADLSEADLTHADLFGAVLSNARLSGTDFTRADLIGAWAEGADFTGAILTDANLSGLMATTAKGLTQDQLNRACGDAATRLPAGLTVPACSAP